MTVCLQTEAYADSNPESSTASPKYTRSEAVYSLPNIEMLRHDQVKTRFPQELDDGRPVILNFIFTTCSAICPMLSGVLSGVQNKLGDEIQGMHLVSISIDPEYDNAERLKEYAAKFKAKPQWQFYSGSVDNVKTLQKAFNAYRGDKMNHSATTYLRASPGKPWVRLDGFLSSDDIIAEYHRLKSSHSSNTGGG
ncbi:MAG: SCO family protein [Methylococcaceae bacterium]|nr:SCO family protein [Methylococcaceae bacterium]